MINPESAIKHSIFRFSTKFNNTEKKYCCTVGDKWTEEEYINRCLIVYQKSILQIHKLAFLSTAAVEEMVIADALMAII